MKSILPVFILLLAAFLLSSCKVIIPDFEAGSLGTQQTPQSHYPPRIEYFDANPKYAMQGEPITLSWNTHHARDVRISGVNKVFPSGYGSHTITNPSLNLNDIMLTAFSDGNFAPATDKLDIQLTLFSKKVPGGYAGPSDKPMLIIDKRANISKTIRQYNLRPINKYSTTKPISPIKPSSPVVMQPMHVKPMLAIPMTYSMMQLNAPQITSPKNNSTFNHYPRTLKLRWQPVNNAASYNVEIDCMNCCASRKWCADVGKKFKQVKALHNTYYKFNFVGAQPGRWRVQAVDKNNKPGKQSQWRNFRFTR